jgi:hypothetical protein
MVQVVNLMYMVVAVMDMETGQRMLPTQVVDHTLVDLNQHLTSKMIMHIDTNLTVRGVLVETDLSSSQEEQEVVKVWS